MTVLHISKPVDDELDDEDDVFEPPSRISFFAEGDDADERVCAAIWNMFVKDSNSRGFDARTQGQRKLSAHWARRRAEGQSTGFVYGRQEKTMKKGEFGEAFHAFEKAHGRIPTAAELFEAIGPEAGTVANVRQSIKRVGLVLAGSRGPAAAKLESTGNPGGGATPKPTRTPRAERAAPSTAIVVQREPRPKRGAEVVEIDPRIAGLVSLRDELAAQVTAIDGVLAVLRPAS